ncbi:MAG: NCS2 family permease [Eubacteriaceae bacterium]|jgi:AGZA family xanthine/uracil permease-like MFS transporter|nr:NCS2 family permease [Eubacteriaceae bacterium]
MQEKLAKLFHFEDYHTDLKTEIMAGLTTFMGMAYILAVNPTIMSATGMDKGAVFTATALAAAIGTLVMALLTNYPFALAPGMGLNAYFAYTVVIKMGYSWEMALAAVFVEGIIFIILSLTNVREAIFNAIPGTLKLAISAGIGLFICMIGFQNAHIVVSNSSTLVSIYQWKGQASATMGLTVALALLGVLFTGFLMVKNVKGGILIGIIVTWLVGIIFQLSGVYVPNAELGLYSLIPDFSNGIHISSIAPTMMHMDFSKVFSLDFFVVIFAFLFVDIFDTLGTLTGCSIKAGYLDENGKLPRIKGALLADAIATSAGACLGVSTTTTYVESSLGIAEGGRSGLVGIVVALFFLLALLFSPIFLAIPSFATAPALIIVGFLMIQCVTEIDFKDVTEGLPAFLCLAAMPMTYSISEGISVGIISYTIMNLLAGKKKNVSILMIVLTVLFICKYIFL